MFYQNIIRILLFFVLISIVACKDSEPKVMQKPDTINSLKQFEHKLFDTSDDRKALDFIANERQIREERDNYRKNKYGKNMMEYDNVETAQKTQAMQNDSLFKALNDRLMAAKKDKQAYLSANYPEYAEFLQYLKQVGGRKSRNPS